MMTLRNLFHTLYFGGFVVSSLHAWMCPPSGGQVRTPFTSSSSSFQRTRFFMSPVNNDGDDDNSIPKNITDLAEKKVRLAKAQAEIDRILNSPIDPPFDVESELKKVVSISGPLVEEGSSEFKLEEQVSQMEEDLYKAVKQQDYAQAARQSHDISQMHVDDCGSVLQVNSKFYDAFSRKDYDDMRHVWLADRSCVCIHPSHKPLLGIRDVLKTWRRMFEGSDGSFQRNWMEPQQIRLSVKATTAIITCEEHVYARRFIRGQRRQTELINKLQATNIFRKIGDKWHMTYHHSSWHPDSKPAKMALKKGGGGMQQPSRSSSSSTIGPGGNRRIIIRGNSSSSSSSSKSPSSPVSDDDEEPSGIDNILGVNNFGPLLGDSDAGEDENEGGPVKRVIMGSLSDILNGNLGDLLGDESSSKNDTPTSNDDLGDGSIGPNGAIIRFHRLGDDDDEDDDEDDDDEDDDSIEETEEESVKRLKQFINTDDGKAKKMNNLNASLTKDKLRQSCIGALRKLSNEGRISPKQKRLLLTDIISCSAKGEYSMVEVAYELLCSESEAGDSEEAEEEFADQCLVFAQSFSLDQ
jgi:hypothetical protein